MIFWRMIEVHLKWGSIMFFVCALFGLLGSLLLMGIPAVVVEVVEGVLDLRVPWDPYSDLIFVAGFALGVVFGLPHVGEHFAEGFKSEMQPLRDEKDKRWVAKLTKKK